MGGKFRGRTWIAGTLPDFRGQASLEKLFHLVPMDPAFVDFAVHVGSDTADCVAELYRSPSSTLRALNLFRRV